MLSQLIFLFLSLFLSVILVIPTAWAVGSSGFENASYSARSLAQSNAVVARPEEPDTTSFNPAGLPYIKGIQFTGGLEGIDTHTFFTSKATGDHTKNTGQLVFVPASFITVNPGRLLWNRVGAGVGLTSPFGLQNRYNTMGNLAQYTGHKNKLNMAAVTIAGGVKLLDNFSVGGGAVDYIAYKYAQNLNFPNSNILRPAVGANTFADGLARTDLDGDGWGWLAGVFFKPFKRHQFGLSYRSRATIDAKGDVKIEGINPLLIGTFPTIPTFQTGIQTDVPLPSNLTIAYAYVPSDKWAAEFDLGYTRWSVFTDQDIAFDRPNTVLTALGTIPRNYDDTWSFNLGGHYRLNDRFDLMGGAFFYTPASPRKHFDNVIPDAPRLAGTFGFRFNPTRNTSVDLTYFGIFYLRRSVTNDGVFTKSGLSIDGRYTSWQQGFMVNFTYRFDPPFLKGPREKEGARPIIESSQAPLAA